MTPGRPAPAPTIAPNVWPRCAVAGRAWHLSTIIFSLKTLVLGALLVLAARGPAGSPWGVGIPAACSHASSYPPSCTPGSAALGAAPASSPPTVHFCTVSERYAGRSGAPGLLRRAWSGSSAQHGGASQQSPPAGAIGTFHGARIDPLQCSDAPSAHQRFRFLQFGGDIGGRRAAGRLGSGCWRVRRRQAGPCSSHVEAGVRSAAAAMAAPVTRCLCTAAKQDVRGLRGQRRTQWR